MSQTVVVGARVSVEDAERFRRHVTRRGLSRSAAVAALIKGALAAEQPPARKDLDDGAGSAVAVLGDARG